jgi:hypothetical protein
MMLLVLWSSNKQRDTNPKFELLMFFSRGGVILRTCSTKSTYQKQCRMPDKISTSSAKGLFSFSLALAIFFIYPGWVEMQATKQNSCLPLVSLLLSYIF